MAHKKHPRRLAREAALSLLYSSDIAETDLEEVIENGQYPSDDLEVSEYAESLALGITDHLDEIDEKLASTSENWALDRMPVVDRSILRLAVYEMMYIDEVPISVAIFDNSFLGTPFDAQKLHQKNRPHFTQNAFGGEDESARFVNGVLGRIARALEQETEQKPSAETSAQPQEAWPSTEEEAASADSDSESEAPDER